MPHPYNRISIQERGIIVGRYLAGDTPKKISEDRGVPSGVHEQGKDSLRQN